MIYPLGARDSGSFENRFLVLDVYLVELTRVANATHDSKTDQYQKHKFLIKYGVCVDGHQSGALS